MRSLRLGGLPVQRGATARDLACNPSRHHGGRLEGGPSCPTTATASRNSQSCFLEVFINLFEENRDLTQPIYDKIRDAYKRPFLSWCLIARNCAKTLEATLKSLRERT